MSELQNYLLKINETANDEELQHENIKIFLRKFLEEDYYYCVASWRENMEEITPFVGYVRENVSCYYIFTEDNIAIDFVKYYEMTGPKNQCLIIKVSTKDLIQILEQLDSMDVQKLMIDEGRSFLCHNISYFIKEIKEILK